MKSKTTSSVQLMEGNKTKKYDISILFVASAGALLAVTGFAKLWTTLSSAKILFAHDPITGIKFRHLLLVIGSVELVVAYVCLVAKNRLIPTTLVTWLASAFFLYRIGLWLMEWQRPCNCLGNLTDALHIPPQAADNIMKAVLAYLFLGGWVLIFWHSRQGKQSGDANEGALP